MNNYSNHSSPDKSGYRNVGTFPRMNQIHLQHGNMANLESENYKYVIQEHAIDVIRAQDNTNLQFSQFKPTLNTFKGQKPIDDFDPGNNHSRPEKILEERIAERRFYRSPYGK